MRRHFVPCGECGQEHAAIEQYSICPRCKEMFDAEYGDDVVEKTKNLVDQISVGGLYSLDVFDNMELKAAISLIDATSRALHNERSKFARQS